jgi:hypothetical protein
VKRKSWQNDTQDFAMAAAKKADQIKALIGRMRQRTSGGENDAAIVSQPSSAEDHLDVPECADIDFSVLTKAANADLKALVELFDIVSASDCKLHIALAWPHIPPRAIMPWMLREVTRGRRSPPLRTLFINVGRPALRAVADIDAWTDRLRARGVYRSAVNDVNASTVPIIGSDAHFYMFLGDTRDALITSVPLISIVSHSVAMNDGVFWRDFDEKTLKGFKRYFDHGRLQSIRKHLDRLTSSAHSPSFAFLMPSHFDKSARRSALKLLPGKIDFVVIDMTTHAVRSRDASDLLRDILGEIEELVRGGPRHVLITTDCPMRYSFLRSASKRRQAARSIGTRIEAHRFRWASRGRGWEPVEPLAPSNPPIVVTVASQECVVAARLWRHALNLDPGNPLANVLLDAAAALKGMALTASSADTLLAPYSDTHDAYHRIKRERHSFEPHYNKALAEISEGRAGHLREQIQSDLKEALSLANALRGETPLLRNLKQYLAVAAREDDVLIVLRHPEDAQQTNNTLLDYLTEPRRFVGGLPNLRVTTVSRYANEIASKAPSYVIWAASAISGLRAYIGDSFAPRQFRLMVAGQDTATLARILDAVTGLPEYQVYQHRIDQLKARLPREPKDYGGLPAALKLDLDRPRVALPFVGQGYLLLDGHGKISAAAGTTFYVLDPVNQELAPHDARSIEVGDSVFVMSDSIREEIEALLREKDERGRTFEQAMVDQYKKIVKRGLDSLSTKAGRRITASRIHEMLFEANPNLPPISKQAVEYWIRAAERQDVDTPYAASDPVHLEAFMRLMDAGVMAKQLADAIRVVRSALQHDGHTNRALFDRLLLDPDSLIHSRNATFEKLQGLRHEAFESVFPVLEIRLDSGSNQAIGVQTEAAAS